METNQIPETTTANVETETPASSSAGAENNEEQTNKTEKATHKLTDEQFIAEYELNHGIYTQIALSIQAHYGIKFSRQAVRERVLSLKRYDSILMDTLMDNAKQALCDTFSPCTDQKLKVKVALFLLGKNGTDRL